MALAKVDNTSSPLPQVSRRLATQVPPSPETAWVHISMLRVDYNYQHPAYTKAQAELRVDYRLDLSGFILVNVREDGSMWVIDGQTRFAVQEELGIPYIRAEIKRGMTLQEEAQAYLIKAVNTQRLPMDFFLAEVLAGDQEAVQIQKILDQRKVTVVRPNQAKLRRRKGGTGLSCISTLRKLMRIDPSGACLEATLDIVQEVWPDDGQRFQADILRSLHDLFRRFGAEIERKAFVHRLQGFTVRELLDLARNYRFGEPRKVSVMYSLQHIMLESYNRGRSAERRVVYEF